MRRPLVLALIVVAAGLALVASRLDFSRLYDNGRASLESSLLGTARADYRIDVIFDAARGIVPGQLVKIAGARVGTIGKITLTRDYKARVQMRIEKRFAPFRTDASCAIKPEGLLGERFIQCQPGTPAGGPLTGEGGKPPTVPVEHTTLPVGVNDLFAIFDAPARDRFALVVATLGLGSAGRGADLNAILRRSNPTLQLTRRVLAVLRRQRGQLRETVVSTDKVLAELARRRGRVRDFVEQAARVTHQTADHRSALAEGVRRLPRLLAEAQPALERLDRLADDATPVLTNLRVAAPRLSRLIGRAEPFAEAALPTVRSLSRATPEARRAVRSARPTVRKLRRFARVALPVGKSLGRTLGSLRDRGFVDNLLTLVYRLSATVGRYDSVSHLFPTLLFFQPACLTYALRPTRSCDAHYGAAQSASRRPRRGRRRVGSRQPADRGARPQQSPPEARPRAPVAPAPRRPRRLEQLLGPLLGRPPEPGGKRPEPRAPLGDLLDFLLK